jgi:hypothetical protein
MAGGAGNFGSISPPPTQRGSLDSVGGGGRTYFEQRPDVAAAFNQNSQGLSPTQFSQQHFQQFGQFEGNVNDPSKQFYQPVYQPQYQNYNMGNPMSISQYGQQPSYGGGFGGGYGGGFGGGYGGYPDGMYRTQTSMPQQQFMPQMQQPAQETTSNLQNAPQASSNQPALQQSYSGQEAVNMGLGGGLGGGFMPQQQFMPQMQTPFRQPMQQFMPQFMPQMQQFQPQMGMGMQTPFSSGMSQPPRTSSGPAQAIVGRSSQMRGTPNVMRRAEGGIASLMDDVE